MKLHLLALLAFSTAACDTDGLLGERFYGGELAQHTDVEAGDAPDAGQEAGDDAAPDAGQDGPVVGDAGQDAPDAREAATDAPAGDSGIQEQDSGGSQDSGQPDSGSGSGDAGLTCPGLLACNPSASWPQSFCMIPHQGDGNGEWTSPPECDSCGTYSCACILAHSSYVPSPATSCSCALVGGTVSVVCP